MRNQTNEKKKKKKKRLFSEAGHDSQESPLGVKKCMFSRKGVLFGLF